MKAQNQRSLSHALDAYRERRRRRRASDTYFGDPEGPLLDLELELDEDERTRRRTDLMDEAEQAEMSIDLAEMLYDVAREEGIDPELAFEVVRSGIAVCPPPFPRARRIPRAEAQAPR